MLLVIILISLKKKNNPPVARLHSILSVLEAEEEQGGLRVSSQTLRAEIKSEKAMLFHMNVCTDQD